MGGPLDGRTILMSGGGSGVGHAIAVAAGRQGAHVALFIKGDRYSKRVPGAARLVVRDIERAGGSAIAILGDLRSAEDIQRGVERALEHFGAIDCVVNNASALALRGTDALAVDQFDVMMQVNLRGTYLLTKAVIPALRHSPNAHILTVSPPLNMSERWLGAHPAYTLSKYGMTLMTLGWAAEYADDGIGANCLWPQTAITPPTLPSQIGSWATRARSPEIMGDAAVEILSRSPSMVTGRSLLDVEVLASIGITNFERYGGGDRPEWDLFVDPTG